MAMSLTMLLALSALALCSSVEAHCGGLHNWAFSPQPSAGKNFVRYRAARCSSWQRINPASLVLGALPVFPSKNMTLNVQGSAEIWWYMDNNCTERATTAVTIDANLTLNGQPYVGGQVNGYGFTGNCSNPGDLYRHNVTMGDHRCNLVWWRRENSITKENGWLWGAAPNVFINRLPPATDALRSVVLYPSPADSDPVCCDLEYAPPPPTSFWTEAGYCTSPPPPSPPSPPSPPKPSPKPSPSTHNPPPRQWINAPPRRRSMLLGEERSKK